jgi:hypothetical protein
MLNRRLYGGIPGAAVHPDGTTEIAAHCKLSAVHAAT